MTSVDGERSGQEEKAETRKGPNGESPDRESLHEKLGVGWDQVAAGLRQVQKGGAIVLLALAAEGVRLGVERGTGLIVVAGTRLAKRVMRRFGRFGGPG